MLKTILISTDGSCYPNPGPGGWAAIFRYKGWCKAIYGNVPLATNIQMEMTAVYKSLEYLKEPCIVKLYTDSEFVINGATKWIRRWKNNNFMTSAYLGTAPKPVANKDMWLRIDEILKIHHVTFYWVKGHADHPDNILCDQIALEARLKQNSGEIILVDPTQKIEIHEEKQQRSISLKEE